MFPRRLYLFVALCAVFATAMCRHLNFIEDYKVEIDILGNGENATISLTFTVNTKGYIGFGVGLNPNMTDSDLFISGVNSTTGIVYGKDYYAKQNGMPTEDSIQNWNVSWGYEIGNITFLNAERLIDTKDVRHDYKIQNAVMYVHWSYGESDDLVYHSRRGYRLLNLFTVDDPVTTTTTINPSSSTSSTTTTNPKTTTPNPTTTTTTTTPNPTTTTPRPSSSTSIPTSTTLNPSSPKTTTPTTNIPSSTVQPPTVRRPDLHANYTLDLTISGSGSNGTLQLLLKVNTTGYVGFGLSRSPNMTAADLFIGGFNFTANATYGKSSDIYVLWSYGENDTTAYHGNRGARRVNLFTVDDSTPTTTPNPVSTSPGSDSSATSATLGASVFLLGIVTFLLRQ